jgi:hypothetical protein
VRGNRLGTSKRRPDGGCGGLSRANGALPEDALIGLLAALMVVTGAEALLRSPVAEHHLLRGVTGF